MFNAYDDQAEQSCTVVVLFWDSVYIGREKWLLFGFLKKKKEIRLGYQLK